jgi:hypothetical protein
MSLVLSASQENNISTQNEPLFQDWGPTNNETNYFWSNAVPGVMEVIPIDFKIKDVVGVPEYGQYTEFRLAAYQAYNEVAPVWLMPLASPGYPVLFIYPIPITTTGLTFSYYPIFQNLGIMPEGNFSFTHHFIIQGKNSNNQWIDISSYNFNTRLQVSDQIVTFSPNSLSYTHFQNTPLPSQEVNIDGPIWKIKANPYLVLSSATAGVTITTITPTLGEPYQEATGTGPAVVAVELGEYYDEPLINPNENTFYSQLTIYAGDTTQVGIIPISIILENTNQFIVSEDNLSFYAVKAIQEPTPIVVFVTCSELPFTIQSSAWLSVTETTVDVFGLPLYPLQIVPIPTANMETGVYNGFVTLTATINGVVSTITITVKYTLDGFVASPYTNNVAFTLDPLFFNFSTVTPDTFFQLTANVKTFDFFTNVPKETPIKEKLPLFNGRGKLNFGKTIHRLMNRFSTINENQLQYKPAEFSLNIDEVSISDLSVIRSTTIQNIKFIAGLSRALINNSAILDFNLKPERVTKNSFFYLNLYVPKLYELRIFKNEIQVQTIPLPFSNGSILFQKITFENFTQGDIIRYTLNIPGDLETEVPQKTFYVIPEGKFSNHVIWENEYLLQSAFEFMGGASIVSEFENRNQTLFKNLVEIMEIIENTKVSKLTISTGWVIKDSIDTIESLMRSKRVWLPINNQVINLRPLSKKIVNEDTERELVEFNIEFQINRNYNEETYTL